MEECQEKWEERPEKYTITTGWYAFDIIHKRITERLQLHGVLGVCGTTVRNGTAQAAATSGDKMAVIQRTIATARQPAVSVSQQTRREAQALVWAEERRDKANLRIKITS